MVVTPSAAVVVSKGVYGCTDADAEGVVAPGLVGLTLSSSRSVVWTDVAVGSEVVMPMGTSAF